MENHTYPLWAYAKKELVIVDDGSHHDLYGKSEPVGKSLVKRALSKGAAAQYALDQRWHFTFDRLIDPSLRRNFASAVQETTPPFFPEQGVFRADALVVRVNVRANVSNAGILMSEINIAPSRQYVRPWRRSRPASKAVERSQALDGRIGLLPAINLVP